MRLIVAEVIWEEPKDFGFGLATPKPEGCAFYPDGRVLVRPGSDNTPKWLGYSRERRRRRADSGIVRP
jgi:hypothetical protein